MVHSPKKPASSGSILQRISLRLKLKSTWMLHLMLFPPLVMLFIFEYIPISGLAIAFQQFYPGKGYFGSKWVGLKHFKYLLRLPDTGQIIENTVIISLGKLVFTIGLALILAILLNELKSRRLSKITQMFSLFPYYLSWVVLGGIVMDVFSFTGLINDLIESLGGTRVTPLISNYYFRSILIGTDVWKNVGYNTIILMAAIAGIDESMYEAGRIDGANRFQKIVYLTIPNLMPMVTLLVVLAMGSLLSAGQDQVLMLYSTPVYETGDILDTYIYRMGLQNGQFSLATAVGLFKSVVGMVMVSLSYWFANKFAGYRVF